jgi:hypothetical protein
MKDILSYVLAVLAGFLPPRYRPRVDRGAGAVSGIVETMSALLILILTAIAWLQPRTDVDLRTAMEVGGTGRPGSGIVLLVEFWMNPLHWVIFYFVVEGMVRTLAALAGHQVIGIAPLYLVSAIHGCLSRKAYERGLGPAVVDEIIRGGSKQGYDLKVYSCRPKLHWNPYMTVEFEGEFYQYFKEEYGTLPRRFIYYLKKNPVGRVVVVVDHYRVDNVLRREPEKVSSTPWGSIDDVS